MEISYEDKDNKYLFLVRLIKILCANLFPKDKKENVRNIYYLLFIYIQDIEYEFESKNKNQKHKKNCLIF